MSIPEGVGPSAQERGSAITRAIKEAERELRARWGFLRHQDALGVACFVVAAGTMVLSGAAFLAGAWPAWACVVLGALSASVLREIEHDLIHNLYFRSRPWAQNLMMALVWPFLGNLPHPWYRRRMHLLHHKTSGQLEDFEERLIGNGMPFGWKKLLAMVEPGLAMLVRRGELAGIPFFRSRELHRAMVPVTLLHMLGWYGFLLGHLAACAAWACGASLPSGVASTLGMLDLVAVVWVLPNVVRQVSVQVLSSSMHYFEDVPDRVGETQVLNAWYLVPFNLFAFNFGSTHTIHHFVVNQPFYLRQMVAGRAHAAFRAQGVRFNDIGTLLRGNRYAGGN